MAALVQMLLPLTDKRGAPFEYDVFAATRLELAERFGGVTAYMRAPARGLWKDDDGRIERDDIVVFEVMVEELDRPWWRMQRELLRQRFQQDELIVRALSVDVL